MTGFTAPLFVRKIMLKDLTTKARYKEKKWYMVILRPGHANRMMNARNPGMAS
ncbi:MAG: hypothetical protein KDC53_06790 [Saprospiraceae bacterium]|nr:hypothetical protein [Saprospiraceae bacterium]